MAWTTPRDWTDGELVTEALLDTHVRDNLKALTEWTTYSPAWTATGGTPTIGDGSLFGQYLNAGGLCHVLIQLAFGGTTSVGTTTGWAFTLPVAMAGTFTPMTSWINDSSGNKYTATAWPSSASTVNVWVSGTAGTVGHNAPMASWAAGDTLSIAGTYRTA